MLFRDIASWKTQTSALSLLENPVVTWGNPFSGPRGRAQRNLRPRTAESLQPGDQARAQVGAQEEVRRRAQRSLHQVRKGC